MSSSLQTKGMCRKKIKKVFLESSSAYCYFWSHVYPFRSGSCGVGSCMVGSRPEVSGVAFFLLVMLELFFGFDVVAFGIEAVRVPAFCEKDVLVGCFQVLVVCFSGIDVSCEFECEQDCSAAAASECDFCSVDSESVPESDGWHVRKGSRFASEQVEATPRVDVDETPYCILPQSGADITSLKTSSFNLTDQVPFQVFVSFPGRSTAVVWVSGIVSLKEVAVGLGLAEWVEEGLISAMVGSRAHDLRVHVQHTGLVSNSTLQFCIRAKGGADNRIRYPDEWTCGRCRLGGCWSTKTTCFRCWARRDFVGGILNPQVIPPRERSFPAPCPGASAFCSPHHPQPSS